MESGSHDVVAKKQHWLYETASAAGSATARSNESKRYFLLGIFFVKLNFIDFDSLIVFRSKLGNLI